MPLLVGATAAPVASTGGSATGGCIDPAGVAVVGVAAARSAATRRSRAGPENSWPTATRPASAAQPSHSTELPRFCWTQPPPIGATNAATDQDSESTPLYRPRNALGVSSAIRVAFEG